MILSNNCPALPTNGLPCVSSSAPGASPTNIMRADVLPSPGTAFLRSEPSSHLRHLRVCSAISSSSLMTSGEQGGRILFHRLETRRALFDFFSSVLGLLWAEFAEAVHPQVNFLTVKPPEKNSAISACWRTTFLMSGLLFISRIVIVFSSEGNKKGDP